MVITSWDGVSVIDMFPHPFAEVAMWVIFAYFVLGIGMNAISRSKPERYTMVPMSAALQGCRSSLMGYGEVAMAI